MAKKPKDESPGRIKQLFQVAKVVHQVNPKAMPIVIGSAVATLVLVVVIGILTDSLLFSLPLAVMGGLAVGLLVFGRMTQRTQYSMLDGQPGAAAQILESMRGNWMVTPAVQANRNLDLVHRAIGRPGVILVSEGPSTRVGKLLGAEKKKIARAASDVPIYDIQVGDEEDQVPLSKLQRHIMKLPRNLKKIQVEELNDRFKALPQSMQMPKGPIPKGARLPKGPKPRTR